MRIHNLYLILSLFGVLLSIGIFVNGVIENQWDLNLVQAHLSTFLSSTFGYFTMAMMLTSGVSLTIFIVHEAQVRREFRLLWAIPALLIFSIGVALPFYLYLRTPKRDE